jgi:hypothetical protein
MTTKQQFKFVSGIFIGLIALPMAVLFYWLWQKFDKLLLWCNHVTYTGYKNEDI